jgi:hypothetical protein
VIEYKTNSMSYSKQQILFFSFLHCHLPIILNKEKASNHSPSQFSCIFILLHLLFLRIYQSSIKIEDKAPELIPSHSPFLLSKTISPLLFTENRKKEIKHPRLKNLGCFKNILLCWYATRFWSCW